MLLSYNVPANESDMTRKLGEILLRIGHNNFHHKHCRQTIVSATCTFNWTQEFLKSTSPNDVIEDIFLHMTQALWSAVAELYNM